MSFDTNISVMASDLRRRAKEAEKFAAQLRAAADLIDPKQSALAPAKANPKTVTVQCSGSHARPNCQNTMQRQRASSNAKCVECRKSSQGKVVWKGEEGLSQGSPSSLGNSLTNPHAET